MAIIIKIIYILALIQLYLPNSSQKLSQNQIHTIKKNIQEYNRQNETQPSDCKNYNEKKKQVYIETGNTYEIIKQYFEKRCDFEIMPIYKKYSTNFDFKWADYHFYHDFPAFKEGMQIINHVQHLKDLISSKDSFVKTLKRYDEITPYKNYNSSIFHFDTYLFDLNSQINNPQEKYFLNKINDGLWLTKDPDGSVGLGIKLFKNVTQIKEKILEIKAQPEKQYEYEDRILQYSVIQKYLHNPLLMDNKKIDMRAYVLIASLDPFVVLYQNGFIRKCIQDYDTNFENFDEKEAFKHLTNRIYQEKHPSYPKEQENLLITPPEFENFLKKKHNFTQNDIKNLYTKGQESVAYSLMAAKNQFSKQKGVFQLLGVDLIWDENFNTYLIEFNTCAGLYQTLNGHKYVIPQLVKSTMDLIIETHSAPNELNKKWQNPEKLNLQRWEILINEAQNFNILDKYKEI